MRLPHEGIGCGVATLSPASKNDRRVALALFATDTIVVSMRPLGLVLLIASPISLVAQHNMASDGSLWGQLSKNDKLLFVMGYSDAYLPGAGDALLDLARNGDAAAAAYNPAKLSHLPNATFGTLIQGVDQCYSDFRNSKLDISVCIDWTIDGINGKSDNERDELLIEKRKIAASHPTN